MEQIKTGAKKAAGQVEKVRYTSRKMKRVRENHELNSKRGSRGPRKVGVGEGRSIQRSLIEVPVVRSRADRNP